MTTWHGTDFHARCRHADNAPLHRAVSDLLLVARPGDPVVVTGDGTESGREDEYAELANLLLRLRNSGLELLLAPGNHDFSYHGLLYYSDAVTRWKTLVRELGAHEEYEHQGMLYRVVDTCKHTLTPLDTARQRVGVGIRRRIPGWQQDAKNRGLRLVLAGHAWPYCDDEMLLLEDRKEFLSLVEGKCHYVGGHIHRAERRVVAGSHFVCGGALAQVGFKPLSFPPIAGA